MAYNKDDNEITFDELGTLTLEALGKRSNGCYGFYDWFCSDKSLKNRAKRLLGAVRGIAKTGSKRFDPAKCFVFFKNNCPCCGGTYDDLRICDKETGRVLLNVCPSKHAVWGEENGFDVPLVEGRSMKDVYAWFAR